MHGQAVGFVTHFKLPHYVDFQAELELVRRLRAEHAARAGRAGETPAPAPPPSRGQGRIDIHA